MTVYAHRLTVAVLALFMLAFFVEHAASLARFGGRRHWPVTDFHGREIPLMGGVSPVAIARRGDVPLAAPIPILAQPVLGRSLFAPRFSPGLRLVTNDFADFNPHARGARLSRDWLVTSGSLFSRDGMGWTGIPDSRVPNVGSTNGTGSATFRMVTRQRDFGNVAVSFDLLLKGLVNTANPVHSWDGVHLFLRYHNQRSLYVVTLARRDGVVLVKKKVPGGPANGGTYYTLGSPVSFRPGLDRWEHVLVTISSSAGKATITTYINDRRLLSVKDAGTGGSILGAGAVGIRGDNADFLFAHFQIRAFN